MYLKSFLHNYTRKDVKSCLFFIHNSISVFLKHLHGKILMGVFVCLAVESCKMWHQWHHIATCPVIHLEEKPPRSVISRKKYVKLFSHIQNFIWDLIRQNTARVQNWPGITILVSNGVSHAVGHGDGHGVIGSVMGQSCGLSYGWSGDRPIIKSQSLCRNSNVALSLTPKELGVCIIHAAKNENSNTKDELFHYPYRHFLCQSHPQESVGLAWL